jgi:hypothetical protein
LKTLLYLNLIYTFNNNLLTIVRQSVSNNLLNIKDIEYANNKKTRLFKNIHKIKIGLINIYIIIMNQERDHPLRKKKLRLNVKPLH